MEQIRSVSPVLLYFHPNVKINFFTKKVFNILSCFSANSFKHLSLFTYYYPFLGGSFFSTELLGMCFIVRTSLHALNHYIYLMGNFFFRIEEYFFSTQST